MSTIKIENGIYWVGSNDEKASLNCNPYLIIDKGEGILLDPGSVLDFDIVFKNVISLIPIEHIRYVILHHQDPDFCSSVPLFEKAGANFQIVTHWRAAILIKYYGVVSPFYIINENEFKLRLPSGRELAFIPTPYLHFPGAFVTYDLHSKILFSSDLFGAFSYNWKLFADDSYIEKMKMFHEHYMPSNEIIRPVMEKLLSIDIAMIAPQHGSIIKDNVVSHIKVLRDLECGEYLKDTKKEIAKNGGYKLLVSLVLKRLYSIFHVNEVEEALEGLEISFDRNSYEVFDFNYRGVDLWNGLFENISKKMGMNWLVVLEPFVNKISKEYDILVPDIYQSKMIDAQSEVWNLNSENVELKKMNEKLSQNIQDVYEQMTKCPITGLYNYTFFRSYLSKSIEEILAENNRIHTSLMVLNVDNMSQIKYTYGDDEVESILRTLAILINEYASNNMVQFRLQGASVACYFINETEENVTAFAEEIRNEISTTKKFVDKITASIGIAYSEEIDLTSDNYENIAKEYYELAISRINLAKKAGENRICSSSEFEERQEEYILIADNDETNVDVLKNVFENLKYKTKAAYTGDEIVEICSDKRPLLIISEMMLPKQDAIQVYRTLQKTTDTKNIPFIIVSSLKNEDAVKSSYALGINYFLKKPYMIAELTGLSQNIIRGNKIES